VTAKMEVIDEFYEWGKPSDFKLNRVFADYGKRFRFPVPRIACMIRWS
jgi:hypothetical protein